MSHIDAKATQPHIGQVIREVRMQTGLTQEQFAAHLGVVFSTLSRWEKDESPLPPGGAENRAVRAELWELAKRMRYVQR